MNFHFLSFLYKFDLLSLSPQLRIFNQSSYKTILSLFLTIIIYIVSIGFSIYLLIDYFRFDNPSVIYSKENDKKTNRTVKIKDTFLLFGLFDSYSFEPILSEAYYTSVYIKVYFNGSFESIPITLEICEFGKNINIKYKDLIDENKILEKHNSNISDYYCISSKHENLTISYLPNIGEFGFIMLVNIYNHSNYIPEDILSLVITEQNIIEHYNRNKPINNYYTLSVTPHYSSNEFTQISIYLQYIKYELDTKFILRDFKKIEAKTFFKMEYSKDYMGPYDYKDEPIGSITIYMEDFFDHYKRSYP